MIVMVKNLTDPHFFEEIAHEKLQKVHLIQDLLG